MPVENAVKQVVRLIVIAQAPGVQFAKNSHYHVPFPLCLLLERAQYSEFLQGHPVELVAAEGGKKEAQV